MAGILAACRTRLNPGFGQRQLWEKIEPPSRDRALCPAVRQSVIGEYLQNHTRAVCRRCAPARIGRLSNMNLKQQLSNFLFYSAATSPSGSFWGLIQT
jgi:hypothetical protein